MYHLVTDIERSRWKWLGMIRVVRESKIDQKFRFDTIPCVFDQSECDPWVDRVLNEENDWRIKLIKIMEWQKSVPVHMKVMNNWINFDGSSSSCPYLGVSACHRFVLEKWKGSIRLKWSKFFSFDWVLFGRCSGLSVYRSDCSTGLSLVSQIESFINVVG